MDLDLLQLFGPATLLSPAPVEKLLERTGVFLPGRSLRLEASPRPHPGPGRSSSASPSGPRSGQADFQEPSQPLPAFYTTKKELCATEVR